MNTLTNWQARQKELEDKYVELMLAKYPLLTDVTTNSQRRNGTRMFELKHKKYGPSRFATYKSGMVRKIIKTRFNELSCYQLNPTRISTRYWMGSNMEIQSYPYSQRVAIHSGVNRLKYLKKYLIKNYNMKPSPNIIEVNGIYYKKI